MEKNSPKYTSLSSFLQLNKLQEETTSKDNVFYKVDVLELYYNILRRVEKEPFKYWNISSLRNYLWAFFKLSTYISECFSDSLNIYDSPEFSLFFTGLYSKYKSSGCKDGLFIFCKKDGDNIEKKVMSHSELLNSEFKETLNKITMKSTFEEYLLGIKGLKAPQIEYIGSDINENHILIDGVDNVPIDYFKILYRNESDNFLSYKDQKKLVEDPQKGEEFQKYKDIMIKVIKQAIEKAQNDNQFNQLPLNFFINCGQNQNPFQYLLPIDFTGTGNPDFCACVSVDKEGKGTIKTLLKIDEVYGNVRVFGKDAVESVKDWWV